MAHFYFENVPHGRRRDGSKLNTKAHFEYICRRGRYANLNGRDEDLVYQFSGNMPVWAKNYADFWQEAERNRRLNGRAYREFRFALQEEFTLRENIELVQKLIEEFGIEQNHTYSLAIHDKLATFDENHRNIHCHLMFSEKIIEKDRPLPPELYFKQYARDHQGNAVSGYRTSRQFISKEMTFALRKRWAELCNAKFADKGLPCRISEKNLVSQREELLAKGQEKEAELLNRQPAPHLGKAYRNPKTMNLIKREVQRLNETDEKELLEENTIDNQQTDEATDKTEQLRRQIHEQKILLFANDLVLRRIAREIQKERQRLAKEQARIDREIEQQIAELPVAVTVADIRDYLRKKQEPLAKAINEKMDAYQTERRSIIPQKRLRAHAIDRLLEHDYFPTIREYKTCKAEVTRMQTEIENLLGKQEHFRTMMNICRQQDALRKRQQAADEKLRLFKKRIEGELAPKIPEMEAVLQEENLQHDARARKLYGEIQKTKRKYEYYEAIHQHFANHDDDEALFTEKIPRMLDLYCKIEGKTRVMELRAIAYRMTPYYLLSDLPQDKNEATIFAVRLGDDITRGTVPKYSIHIEKDTNKRWHIDATEPAFDEKQQPAKVRLYAPHPTKTIDEKSSFRASIQQEALQAHAEAHHFHLICLADALLEKEKSLHPIVQTNDRTEEQDKAIRAEEKLYKGWSR